MHTRELPDFEQLVARVARELAAADIPFMLIGGQAVLLHGEARLTQDIDVTLGVDPSRLGDVLDVCKAAGLRPLPQELEAFVRRTFVLPAEDDQTLIRVDLIFSTTPYERQAIARALRVELAGVAVPFAAAEDLILHKLFAGRPRDVEDAHGVVRRKGRELDWTYLNEWAREFCVVPGREDLPQRMNELRREMQDD
jgi:predicted nucleotidyltransferase